MDPISIKYYFRFRDGTEEKFKIDLHPETLLNIKPGETKKDWMKLEFHQCDGCRLKKSEFPLCPIAANLDEAIHRFEQRKSHEAAYIRVDTEHRTYEKVLPLQQGLGSLIGIIMVTSGCPTMDILKPMVRFHLPFATVEETMVRSVSFYLLGQYFRHKQGNNADLDLDGLVQAYTEIQKVNIGITGRLQNTSDIEAGTNAIIILDVFAKILPNSIVDGLMDIKYIFNYYLTD